jgi:L-glutamine:scyllo-inosose aminotransferase/L-glutamine:2-deoxy-scyllo-inosose/3-amino-2,3-dideoxy-scyllo-inosose aminotransferase
MADSTLALFGGQPVRDRSWPRWPRSDDGTFGFVREVLESTRWALSGPSDGRICFERRFAQAFARFHDVEFCTPTSSGTGALTIALQALGVGHGDEVLVPGLTWVACASAVANLGAIPVLVDIEPNTLAMSADAAAAALTERTAAILVVHPFCSLADLDRFTALSSRAHIPLIEDCAQAHGARWRGMPVGTLGSAGCFSMQQSKLLTSGEGGAVITKSADLYDLLEQLRSDGRRFATVSTAGRLELVEVGDVQGRNLCLSELQAAVLLDRLRHLPEENQRRAEMVSHLEAALGNEDGVSLLPADPRVTVRTFYNLVLRFDGGAFAGNTVDAIARALTAELGTQVNPVYTPLNRHPLLCPTKIAARDLSQHEAERLDMSQYGLPEADLARTSCATLTQPVFLADKDGMDDVVTAIRKVRTQAVQLLATPQGASSDAF